MTRPWLEALHIYNAGHQSWAIPRKGTNDFAAVRRMQDGGIDAHHVRYFAKNKRAGVPKKASMTLDLESESDSN